MVSVRRWSFSLAVANVVKCRSATAPALGLTFESGNSFELEEPDMTSFVGTGIELHKAAPAMQRKEIPSPDVLPEDSEDWEAQFSQGMQHSESILGCDEGSVGSWVADSDSSGSTAPRSMLLAEELLLAAVDGAPESKKKDKQAERALRIYYHAKWLAERGYAKAAEWRYHEAANIARQCRRSVMASHALSRLGYFLVQWRRFEEAHTVLKESMKLNTKKNPLGPYMFGVLERQIAGADVERLRAAEELILNSAEQPSHELEQERATLIADIHYWRKAELDPTHCFETSSVARVVICLAAHFGKSLQQAFAE